MEDENELRKLTGIFVDEALERTAELEDGLLQLEKQPHEREMIDTIFRAVHTIKGSSGCMGFTGISAFAHSIETILDLIRKEKLAPDRELVTALLDAADLIKEMVGHVASGAVFDYSRCDDIVARMDQLKTRLTRSDFKIIFIPDPELFRRGIDPAVVMEDLKTVGELVSVKTYTDNLPPLSEMNPEELYLRWDIVLKTEKDPDEIRRVFEFVEEGSEIRIFPLVAPEREIPLLGQMLVDEGAIKASDVDDALKTQKKFGEILVEQQKVSPGDIEALLEKQRKKKVESFTSALSSTIRVDLKKLDHLINAVGELVIVHSMLHQVYEDRGNEPSDRISVILSQIRRIGKEIQENTMSLRMLPVGEVFQRFTRLVRELSDSRHKNVRLLLSGQEIELDKGVLEKIADPLTHLIRNAIDHGIETPDERTSRGKPPVGTIHLSAYQTGDSVHIEVEDDGRGLDRQKILEKALEKGILKNCSCLTDEEICNVLFLPGFSTTEDVTDISGRGVGLDVVKRNIDSLNGRVYIRTGPGVGTTVSIKLPLTLAIVDGLKVLIADEAFIIPLHVVIESLRPGREEVKTFSEKGEYITVRGDCIPFIRLYRELGITPKHEDPCESIAVVTRHDGKMYCLMVDELAGEQQVVIKNFGESMPKVHDIAGGTILGDGKVALVLHLPGLIENAVNRPDPLVVG